MSFFKIFKRDKPQPQQMSDTEEQGPIECGNPVLCWMDANETQEVTDDVVSHIRKI